MRKTKSYFQKIHYKEIKPNFLLEKLLLLGEFFYKNVINFKNKLYEEDILKEKKVNAKVICIGNLTTGGVGKTPIVTYLANKLSKDNIVTIIQRGYGAKLQNKTPNVIKDFNEIKFKDGSLCGDEPFQVAKNVKQNVIVLTCSNRVLASEFAIEKYGANIILLDDGFSNRKIKKDETIILVDSKMRFGNNHLLPLGPLREPVNEIKRANKIILVNKQDENIIEGIDWVKKFNKETFLSKMTPKRIYNIQTKAQVVFNNQEKPRVIAFCAIGQPNQFYDYIKNYYSITETMEFSDHHKYSIKDIQKLTEIASKNNVSTFITTQKDEAKLINLIKKINGFSFNVLELQIEIEKINEQN